MNEQLIDTVISPVVTEQVTGLTKILSDLDIQMSADIKSANSLNTALANSRSFTEYNNNATKAALQLEKVQQAQNKTAQSTITLNNAQAKGAADQQARDDKALLALQKKQAAQATADAKEIASAEGKAAKLQAIADKQALAQIEATRKANVQFPTAQSSTNPVTQEPSGVAGDITAVRYEPIITGNENMALSATKSTEALSAENAVMLEQQEVLGALTVEQRANIEALLALQAERAANAAELKELNIQDQTSGERAVFLTAEQLRLKVALAETTLELNRQTKEQFAQAGSINELNTRLAQQISLYDALSVADRENIAIGGVMVAEIETTKLAIIDLEAATLRHSKSVGDYTNAINKSSAGMGLADKISNQFTRSMIRMGVQFILLTVILGAVTWLATWISKLDIFTGRLDKAIQKLKALNDAFASTEYTKTISDIQELTENIRLAKDGFLDKTKVLNEYNKTLGKTMGETDSLDKAEQEIIKHGQAYIQMILLKAAAQLALGSAAKEMVKAAQIAQQKPTDAEGDVDMGMELITTPKEHRAAIKKMQDEDVADKKKSADLQLKIFKDFQDQAAKIAKDNKFDFFGGTEDKKGGKTKVNDTANTDLLEFNRIKLEETKKTAKLVLDNENQSYAAREVALGVYIQASRDLIKNSEAILDKDTTLRKQQKLNKLEELKNASLDIDSEEMAQRLKIKKEHLAEMLTASKESEQEQLESLEQANILVNQAREKQKNKLIEDKDTELANGKIKGKEYREAVQDINDAYNIRKIADEIVTQKAILELREATKQKEINDATSAGATPEELKKIGSEADKGIQPVKNKLGDSYTALQGAITTRDNHQTTNAYKDAEDKKKAIEQAAYEVTVTAIDEIDKLRQRAYENEIARLEKRAALVEDNANNEKLLVNASIASSATKAREIALIDAQAASAKKAIQVEENQIKTKEAKAEKEAAIAKIIVNGALAIVKAFAEGGLVLEALAIATVGVELATAIATPLPTFAGGTKSYPGGLGIWGEAGQELATLPDGSRQLSNGAAIANFPKGTVITPHMELMQMIRPEPIKYVGGQEIGWQEVLAQLKKMEPKAGQTRVNVNVDMGYEQYKSSYLRR